MLEILRAEALGEITAGEAEVRRAEVERVRISGLTIWGAAVTADDQFINHYLLENVTAVLEATLYNIIPTLGADSDVLQTVIKNQVFTRLTHEGRTTPPRLTRPFFRVVDEVLCRLRVAHVCGGVDPYDNDFDARRVGLPVRGGGFGWRKLEDTAVPAFLGGMELAFRQCADHGSPVVRELLGAASYGPGGTWHQQILSSGVPMAVEVESAFAELIGMAGGTAVMEDAGVPGEPAQMGRGSREEGVRVQKQAMKAIERRTKAELDAACRERGARDDAGKHAFMEACAWSGILFSACPTRQDCLPTAHYQIRVAYLLGRLPSRFAPALGMLIGEVPEAGAVDRRVTVGAGGVELLTANPPDCRVTRPHVHNQAANRLIQKWMEYVGPTNARDERAATSWFTACVPAAQLEEYRQLQYRVRENGTAAAQPQVMRGDGVLAGGMAQYCRSADHPCATPGDALLEIKTDFSNANTRAGRRICDTRAEQVPGEYQRRAASCDQRWGVGRAFRDRLAATKLLPVAFDRYGGCSKSMEELVRIMSAAGAERLAGQYGVSAGVNATGVLAWSAKRKMARLYHADLAELAWARYDKVTIQASVPGADGQQLGAGAEEQLDNRPDPRAREAYAFFQHGATETAGGCVDGWGG